MKLVRHDFPCSDPFGPEMAQALDWLHRSINDEPGFVWKLRIGNAGAREAGGIHAFADKAAARACIDKPRPAAPNPGSRASARRCSTSTGPLGDRWGAGPGLRAAHSAGSTAVASISTFAASSTSAETTTIVMAGKW